MWIDSPNEPLIDMPHPVYIFSRGSESDKRFLSYQVQLPSRQSLATEQPKTGHVGKQDLGKAMAGSSSVELRNNDPS